MKKELFLPVTLVLVFALSRIPGCLPENFSAAYALMFCAARGGFNAPCQTRLLLVNAKQIDTIFAAGLLRF